MKKLICILLSLLICIGLCGCNILDVNTADTEPDVNAQPTETDTETASKTDVETETKVKTDTETEIKIETKTETTESETETETETVTEIETDTEAATETTKIEATEVETETESETEISTQTETVTEIETEVETESNIAIETTTEVEIETETHFNTDTTTTAFDDHVEHDISKKYRCGFEGNSGYLYIIIDGEKIIYERYQPGTDSFTKKEELGLFIVDNDIEGVAWSVYSTEEYPDLSYVLIISGTHSSWTYYILENETEIETDTETEIEETTEIKSEESSEIINSCEHNWERVENLDEYTAMEKCSACGNTRTYTDLGDEISFIMWRYNWDGWGVSGKHIYSGNLGDAIVEIVLNLEETGETMPKISDDIIVMYDEYLNYIPTERGTVWIDCGKAGLFRLDPSMSEICRVETHLGEGVALEMTDTLKELLRQAWYYAPYDYWDGTYNNGEVTLNRVYNGDSAIEWVEIESIHIENAYHTESNKIVFKLKKN